MNLLEILEFAEEYLKKYSFSKSRLESEKLLAFVLKIDRLSLYVNYDRVLEEEEKAEVKKYLALMAKTKKSFEEVKEKKEEVNYGEENRSLVQKSIDYLHKFQVPSPKLDAEYIFSHVLGVKRNMLSLYLDRKLKEEEKQKIRELLIARGKERRPLQYLLGKWEFYGYEFLVDERALIPRADTEILVEQVKLLAVEKGQAHILDIGTGTGAIALTLAKEIPELEVLGVDKEPAALSLAEENREYLQVKNVKFLESDLFSNIVGESFDIIVSNPPYISWEEYEGLMPEVKVHEPQSALTDFGDGYFFYRKITEQANAFLKEKGYLCFEIAYQQGEEVKELLEQEGFEGICIVKDYSGKDRVVFGRKGGSE